MSDAPIQGAQRPTTSNPKRRNVTSPETSTTNFNPQASATMPFGNLHDLDPMVLWSAEDVPAGILARPHTSNPRYVDGLMSRGASESPQKTTAESGASYGGGVSPPSTETPINGPSDTPTGNNSNHSPSNAAGAPILWSDNMSIDPHLLARPVTANPWLQRVFDCEEKLVPAEPLLSEIAEQASANSVSVHISEGVSPTSQLLAKERAAGILWSTDDVQDWRLLARPHSSNPILERSRQSHDTAGDDAPVPNGESASYVLWSREVAEENRPAADSVRKLVASQQRQMRVMGARIAQLEQCLIKAGVSLPEDSNEASDPSEVLFIDGSQIDMPSAARPVTAIPNDPSVRLTIDRDPSASTADMLAKELANAEALEYHDAPYQERVSAMATSPISPQSPLEMSPGSISGDTPHKPIRVARPTTAGSSRGSPLAATAVPTREQHHVHYQATEQDDGRPRSALKVIAPMPPKIAVDNRTGRPSSRTEGEIYIREDKGEVPNEEEVEQSFLRGFHRSPTQQYRNYVNAHETVKVTGYGFVPRSDVHTGLSMPPRPESALPSRRAARLRLAIGQCRPTTAPSSRDGKPHLPTPQTIQQKEKNQARPASAATRHAVTEGNGPRRCASATLSRPFLDTTNRHLGAVDSASYGKARDLDIRKEYANIVRKGEHAVTKDDFKALYLERASDFGMKPSDNDVEDLMAPFYKEGVNHLSIDEFAVLFLKMSAW